MTTPTVKNLIVDSSPLLTAPLSSLRGIAKHYLVTSDVVRELRDTKGREVIREAEIHLPAEEWETEGEKESSKGGFVVRDPTIEAIAKVTSFARLTGDIAVLSAADIRVLALCLTLELEENGSWRVRDFPGQVLTGPPGKAEAEEQEKETETGKEAENVKEGLDKLTIEEGQTTKEAQEDVKAVVEKEEEIPPVASTSTLEADKEVRSSVDLVPVEPSEEDGQEDDEEQQDDDEDSDNDSDVDSDSSGSSWITPENLHDHQVASLGLFSAPSSTSQQQSPQPKKPKVVMKSAVLTGDFAMQNVGIQMGLNVLGSGGKRVREVRTWVLRCHACFKLCKNPEKRFCPSCGGATLTRTSVTYVPVSPAHPSGYILHLKSNYQYRLRGTRYSLPNPKMGKAGGSNAELVLREDQKEWTRGIKTAEIMRSKETRAILRGVMDEKRRTGGADPTASVGGLPGWNDRDWQAPMQLGEKGRRRGGKNGAGGEVRVDSSGLPVIGHGRRNVNQSKKRK